MMKSNNENTEIEAMNTENNTNQPHSEQNVKPRSAGRTVATIILLLVALAILMYVGLHRSPSQVVPVKPEDVIVKQSKTSRVEPPKVDVSKIVDQKQAEYLQKNRQALADFQAKLKTAGAAEFKRARNGIDDAVSELSGYKVTAKLCWKMAKDKLRETHDTEDAISAVITPKIVQPCMDGNRKISEAYQTFCLQIQENRNQYHADLISAVDGLEIEQLNLIEDSLNNDLPKVNEQVIQLASEKALTAIGIAIEAMTIRATYRMLVNVCGHIAAKLAGSATAAGVSAVADGPLPIGDAVGAAIFVGFTAWSAYDIYKVSKILPAELRSAMETSVQNAETTARTEAEKKSVVLVELCEQESLTAVQNLKQELK